MLIYNLIYVNYCNFEIRNLGTLWEFVISWLKLFFSFSAPSKNILKDAYI